MDAVGLADEEEAGEGAEEGQGAGGDEGDLVGLGVDLDDVVEHVLDLAGGLDVVAALLLDLEDEVAALLGLGLRRALRAR